MNMETSDVRSGAVSFGDALHRHCVVAGLTQEALAERAHLSARAISDLERGVKRRPRRDTLALLADALSLVGATRAAFEAAARDPDDPHARPPRAGSAAHLGRAGELALLGRHLEGEGPPLFVLAGEPGIGKSRLLREAASQGARHGLCVLEGGRQRSDQDIPYASLVSALRRPLRPLRHLRAALGGCAWLVRLLPELADSPIPPLPAWTPTPRQERQLMVEAAGRFLANAAGTAGALLVLDDLQWAGGDDLAPLATLLHGSEASRLRVVGAYRDTEIGLDSSLAVALADLTAAGLAARRHLDPLALPEASALLDDLLASEDGTDTPERPSEPLRARVLRRACGVPFYLLSYAEALHGATEEADIAAPWDIAQSIRQRVAGLPREGRAVLGTAAVIGRVVAPWLLMDAALLTEREALEGLDAACDARLLVEAGDATYVFAHDVIRDIVEADVGAARRAILHRQVGEALERRSETTSVETLAYHYGRSDHADKAILYLERAGDHAHEQHALIAADGYYRDAARRLDERGRGPRSRGWSRPSPHSPPMMWRPRTNAESEDNV